MLADNKVLNFVDSLFNEARLNDELPAVRTPQEGYGIMAERFLSVSLSTTGTKKAVADALEAMSEGDRDTFINTCDRVYAASVQVADAALKMAAAMQNVVTQLSMYEGQSANDHYAERPEDAVEAFSRRCGANKGGGPRDP